MSGGFGGDHCLAPARSVDAPVDGASGRYGRLFPELPPPAGEDAALLALGRGGGVCDGGDSCMAATDTAAVWPLFGQFISHDSRLVVTRSSTGTSDPQTKASWRVSDLAAELAELGSRGVEVEHYDVS